MESWWEFAFWMSAILVVAFGVWPSPRPKQLQALDVDPKRRDDSDQSASTS